MKRVIYKKNKTVFNRKAGFLSVWWVKREWQGTVVAEEAFRDVRLIFNEAKEDKGLRHNKEDSGTLSLSRQLLPLRLNFLHILQRRIKAGK